MLTAWVYRSILWPIGKLQEATKQIRDGNLDFTLDVEDDDEIGQLCQNFEEMRIRLKESTEEKIQYDKESKELISNISHDLKTRSQPSRATRKVLWKVLRPRRRSGINISGRSTTRRTIWTV